MKKQYENFFLKSSKEKEVIFSDLRRAYGIWREELQKVNKPFFAIHSDFKHIFLKNISGGALKLYLYLGFHAKYQSGELWHTSEEISTFFNKDQRTIGSWFKELEELGLIFREQKGFRMKANTFLKPYGLLFDGHKTDNSSYKTVVDDIKDSISLEWEPFMLLMLNNHFKEYTVVVLYKEENVYHCSYFIKYPEEDIKRLRVYLKTYGVKADNFDIDAPISTLKTKDHAIYNYLMKYFGESNTML